MTSRVPPLLQPYLRPPSEASLILLTGVLGATTNWLTLRFLHAALNAQSQGRPASTRIGENQTTGHEHDASTEGGQSLRDDDTHTAVLLVSWLRDWDFWRTEGRRCVGLDLARLVQNGRFAFVDGLTGLLPSVPTASTPHHPTRRDTSHPLRPSTQGASPNTASFAPPPSQAPPPRQTGIYTLSSLDVQHIKDVITTAVSALQQANADRPFKIFLILDAPDLLLALSPPETLQPTALSSFLLSLRTSVHSCLVTVSADGPLIHNATPYSPTSAAATPLEVNHASFVTGLAHQVAMVMSVRLLDTGAARDVSGVLRITVGDEVDGLDGGGERDKEGRGGGMLLDREVLYFVGGDGGVSVFERGT